jgi:hypothetical protein
LWLAETSQQPISQTTWLKVIPHGNHCNHYQAFTRSLRGISQNTKVTLNVILLGVGGTIYNTP